MLQLRTFGGLWVSDANRQRVGRSLGRKPLALLALLARANGQAIARDRLLALLWPEKDQGHARNALNQMIFVIRRSLRSDLLELERHEIALVAHAWRTDVGDFERALADQALERAVALYTGPFLDAFYVPDAGELERWVESERAALRRKYLRALERLATASDSRVDVWAAAGWWQQLALAEPATAQYTFALMRALASAGEDAAAIDAAQVYERYVRSELQTGGDPRISAFVYELRHRNATAGATPRHSRLSLQSQPTARQERA